MAIKTKKITDLTPLSGNNDALSSKGDKIYFLGTISDITGKIDYTSIINDVRDIVANQVSSAVETYMVSVAAEEEPVEEVPSASNEDLIRLENFTNQIKRELSDVVAAYKELNNKYISHVTSNAEIILTLQTQLAEQETKIATLEGFVQALQKDGYLTLKEIQRAAADACPLCNHTHEEEQTPVEPTETPVE